MRVAITDDDEQVLMPLLRAARELGGKTRLAEARLARDETDLTPSLDNEAESLVEQLEFLLPTYEYRAHIRILITPRFSVPVWANRVNGAGRSGALVMPR